jgi:SAM-dependent methyltransferase
MRGLRAKVCDYYSGTLERHGPSPLGVDWPNTASQYLRFVQLLKIVDLGRPFSLNDFGCGYGALLEFLAIRHCDGLAAYYGTDISPKMVAVARQRWAAIEHATFEVDSRCSRVADYSLASGVFNIRLGHPLALWEAYLESILEDIHASSRLGFAVNFMLPHDAQSNQNELYRSEPTRWIAFCEKLGGSVQLLREYGLREFTLLVRTNSVTTVLRKAEARKLPRPSPRSAARRERAIDGPDDQGGEGLPAARTPKR